MLWAWGQRRPIRPTVGEEGWTVERGQVTPTAATSIQSRSVSTRRVVPSAESDGAEAKVKKRSYGYYANKLVHVVSPCFYLPLPVESPSSTPPPPFFFPFSCLTNLLACSLQQAAKSLRFQIHTFFRNFFSSPNLKIKQRSYIIKYFRQVICS